MTKAEVNEAEKKLKQSTEEFDEAIDHLKKTISDGVDRANHMIESLKSPIEKAEKIVDESKQTAERFLTEVQNTTGDFVKTVQEKPLTLWVFAFVSGIFLGMTVTKRRYARPREERKVAV